MPSFRAINALAQPERSPEIEDEELPDIRTILAQNAVHRSNIEPAQEEPSDICGRHWEVIKILSRKAEDGQLWYLIRWADSTLLTKDVRQRPSGIEYVRCDGKDWDIQTCRPARPTDDGKPQLLVVWKNSWRAMDDLLDGAEGILPSIQEFEVHRQGHTAQHEAGLPREFLGPKLRPRKGVDYSPTVRAWFRDNDGKMNPQRQGLMNLQPRRQLLIRDKFIKRESLLDLKHEAKGNACLVTDSGYEQLDPCELCINECGPFLQCVVGDDFSNGACSNCAYGRRSKSCNFNIERKC